MNLKIIILILVATSFLLLHNSCKVIKSKEESVIYLYFCGVYIEDSLRVMIGNQIYVDKVISSRTDGIAEACRIKRSKLRKDFKVIINKIEYEIDIRNFKKKFLNIEKFGNNVDFTESDSHCGGL